MSKKHGISGWQAAREHKWPSPKLNEVYYDDIASPHQLHVCRDDRAGMLRRHGGSNIRPPRAALMLPQK